MQCPFQLSQAQGKEVSDWPQGYLEYFFSLGS